MDENRKQVRVFALPKPRLSYNCQLKLVQVQHIRNSGRLKPVYQSLQ